MRLKRYLLLEKTFNISKDVDYIYKRCFASMMKEIKKHSDFSEDDITKLLNGKHGKFFRDVLSYSDSTLDTIDSSELPSKQAQEAHWANHANIRCGVFADANYYKPLKPGYCMIQISINPTAFALALNGKETIEKNVPPNLLSQFYNDLEPARIKVSISHEISHWLNDTFHNFHISKLLKIAKELSKPEMVKLHKKDVNMTHFEIDAQIHGIKQLKKSHRKDWDNMNLKDVFHLYTSLNYMAKQILGNYGKDVFNVWQKLLMKRMAREKLLGKNMRSFMKPEEIR